MQRGKALSLGLWVPQQVGNGELAHAQVGQRISRIT